MLIVSSRVTASKLQGDDGLLGRISDLLFDDESWLVRYLVIDTGKWLPGRKVVLRPEEVTEADWHRGRLHCRRTKQQIEDSPPLGEHEPVSRQHEARLADYFLWTHAGSVGAMSVTSLGGVPATAAGEGAGHAVVETDGDPHLRSVEEVKGYGILASDGEIGHVEDFILDDADGWLSRYMVVDTGNWLPGRKVLVASGWCRRVDWGPQRVEIDLTREIVEKSPEYDPSQPVNPRYEKRLYDYYGRPSEVRPASERVHH